ncbi:uncharacterized protein Z519_11008 [Cladophialophora bantiana CBS 173.52]|uniref:BTB domain-containing protein n=1 Tax=Cladophialophora bantiana (strain ATCC 10958 / CBS 173.52 / CDC B-1940 / NIH 8579) TaxID=1442370 RepID=A0A0D2HV94_CLAB1|nr:uncharacterized protein Z519_11008 [Cladophialophora bantiana CBS 173.52]KIW88439.1 hypothetical protein Z519_11008 [Cladophialophora bantiana CBS 173.52]
MRVSTEVLVSKSLVFRAMLTNGVMIESLAFKSNNYLEIPLPDDNAKIFLVVMNILHENTGAVPDQVDFTQLVEIATLVDKYSWQEAVRGQAQRWIESLRSSVPVSSTDELLPWIWISWVFHFSDLFRKLTAVAQKEATGPIDMHNPYGVPVPEVVKTRIGRQRVEAISQIQSLLVSQMEDLKETAMREQDLFGDTFEMVHAFRLGFLTLSGFKWGILSPRESDSHHFEGVSFRDLSTHIRTMVDIDDWIVGTKPPGTHLPFVLDGMSAMVPLLGRILGSPGSFAYGTSNIKKRFVELITDLEQGEWGLDLKDF